MRVFQQSIPKPGRRRNGDHLSIFEDEKLFIACVADGVAGRPCDYQAAKLASEGLIRHYLGNYRELGIRQGMAKSLCATFAELYATTGDCRGMRSTLLALIIDKQEKHFYYLGIGDSRLLYFRGEEVKNLAPETPFEPALDSLSAQAKDGGPLLPGAAFALMTDGFADNRKGYVQELRLAIDSDAPEARLAQLMQLNRLTQYDDMTLVVVVNQLSGRPN